MATTWSLGLEAQDEKLDQRSTFGTTTDSVDPSRSHAGGENLAATYGIIGLANLSTNCV